MKKYTQPQLNVELLQADDVIRTSVTVSEGDCQYSSWDSVFGSN